MSMRATRIAVIGCGTIGVRHVQAWEQVTRAGACMQITVVCDQDRARAEQLAQQTGRWQRRARVEPSAEAALDDVDAVDVCLPTGLHRAVVCDALDRGCHVLVEKPIATTIADGRLMATAAERAGRVLSVAEDHRRTLAVRTARWVLHDTDWIGVPELVRAQRTRYEAPKHGVWAWRTSRRLGGGGWATDNGAHLFDTLQYLLGPVRSVSAIAKRIVDRPVRGLGQGVGVDEREDLLTALLRFENGTTGLFCSTSALPCADDFVFALQGTAGAIIDGGGELFHPPLPDAEVRATGRRPVRLRDLHDSYLNTLTCQQRERMFPSGLTDGFAIECAEFLRAIRQDQPVEIDAHAALSTLALSLALYESALLQDTVQVADVLDGRVHRYQDSIDAAPGAAPEADFKAFASIWPPSARDRHAHHA
jgi:predicted dehydrogenase